jgi:flotillin
MNIMMGAVVFGALLLTALIIAWFLTTRYKRVQGVGHALVITRTGGKRDVTLTGTFVWPVINQMESIDIRRKTIAIERIGRKTNTGEEYEGLSCKDGIRANMKVDFFIGVNPETESIIKVAEHFGCQAASDEGALKRYFSSKFSEVLKTVVRNFDFQELLDKRDQFRKEVTEMLENDLDGFILHQVSIDMLEMTPLEDLDANNIIDAEGIRKITEITSEKNIRTAELDQTKLTEIKKKEVTGENARLQLNKSLSEEKAKTDREIAITQITENNATAIHKEEARLETEKVRLKIDEQIKIQEENVQREIDVAKINNEKVVGIQREQVERAKSLEKVTTDRQVVEQEINKEKFVETEKSQIADIVAIRTKTERNIAQEEQETKNLVTKHETERHILTSTTDAKAKAESESIVKTTAANADLEVTKKTAEQDIVKAETKLATSEKEATATIKTAEATRFEKAASGLAEADVRARIAEVAEKEIEVEANRVLAVGSAEADVRVKQADAIEKEGKAEAIKVREIGLAQAEGSKAQYAAMDSISVEVREHEVRKLNIEKDKEVQIAGIAADREVAIQNGQVMAAAMEKADIQILGNGEVFDQIKRSVVSSKALDARIGNSELLTTVFDKYKTGERDLAQDLKDVLEKSEFSTGDVGGLLMTTTLADLIKSGKLADVLSNFTKLQ